jgi:predicted nucleotidyltransferase/DNA-binding MarR family transcriptional regulator
MNFIQLLPLSRSRLDVLFNVYAEQETYLRKISQQLDMNPSLTHSILKKLHKTAFMTKRKMGKEILYVLNKNRDYPLLVELLEEYHLEKVCEEKKVLKTLLTLLFANKELYASSHKIYFFGSYVAGKPTKKSDIDILFVHEDQKMIGKTCREISTIVGMNINPLIYKKKKFKKDLRQGEALLSSIVKHIRNRAIVK